MDDFLGKCIDGKYEIKKLIASGGMGEVYLAQQKGTGQEVALKKLKREYYQDSVVVERFINEARLYGRVTHPNAVKLHDIIDVDGQLCIVMEFVAGKTLTHYVETGYSFSTRQIVDIGIQVADALATLHQAGIIHRDLKTDNIMLLETVSGRFSVKILDFGIAKFKDGRSNSLTQQGVIVGTPEFMSPEQCYGMPVDQRADIYSFGILLYVIICGHLPFEASTALALLNKQANEPLPDIKRPDSAKIPLGLEGVVRKCTMKKPEDRYQSFADVIADLTCLQDGRTTSLELDVVSLGKRRTRLVKALESPQEEANEISRKYYFIMGVGALILVVAVVVILLLTHHENKETKAVITPKPSVNVPVDPIEPELKPAEPAQPDASQAASGDVLPQPDPSKQGDAADTQEAAQGDNAVSPEGDKAVSPEGDKADAHPEGDKTSPAQNTAKKADPRPKTTPKPNKSPAEHKPETPAAAGTPKNDPEPAPAQAAPAPKPVDKTDDTKSSGRRNSAAYESERKGKRPIDPTEVPF